MVPSRRWIVAALRGSGRSLLLGVLVGLVACQGPGRTIRVGARYAEITIPSQDIPDAHVEVPVGGFMEAVELSGRLIIPVADPLEHARRLAGYPGFREGRLHVVLASWLPSSAPDQLTREYGAWCAAARHLSGDCLSLLDGPSLGVDGRASLALSFAFGDVLEETTRALKRTVDPQVILTMIVTTMAMYLMLWVFPEPVSKGVAAVLTAGLMAYVGVGTVWSMIRGWRHLVNEASTAKSLDDLREAGRRFGQIIGQNAARIFVMLASAALASTLATALEAGTLPGATQATEIAASQGGFRLAAASEIQSVTVAAEGEITIALAPVAVAMAPARAGGSAPAKPPSLRKYDIEKLGRFNIECRRLDDLCGHEMLQNAWLKAHGYVTKRSGPISQGNPAVALEPETHLRVNQEQLRLGLHDPDKPATMSAAENIRLNAEAMRAAGIPEHVIQQLAKEAATYAATLAR
jgi:hypothetical protein